MSIENKVILLTGGTGSFGQKFVEVALSEHNPKVIRIFSRGEFLQHQMRLKFNDDNRLRFFIGDVRDRDRLYRAMNGVDIVIHAAALKQVPTCEYNPIEAVKTNIDGAINIIDVALDNDVSRVIAISSDKAVQPVNLYGATKLVAEKLFIQGNAYTGGRGTKFSCIRYGNVVASRGSVIELFLAQRNNGTLTITDERMTRFWLTLEQGVRFVLNCIEQMQGGEIFVPKLPSMKIMDITDVIAPKAQKRIIGIRPGEKLHETLLTEEESSHTHEFNSYFAIEPEQLFHDGLGMGSRPTENFRYSSDTNNQWLTKEQLKVMIEDLT
ncbi:MAG: UDP-N-acetylglucosamine 4,6-dehydratase (inverting) [Dehalococcoidales bacterium]|jgi:UDP-N-acetylglucosamine 4,6-dehydratase (inverting)|nr:UDP-N-acetylglucosamine 4,6-dehydratase (inverting) [Dehalococcoidales bacterium]